MSQVRQLAIDRVAGGVRTTAMDRVVVEAPLALRAQGVALATIMRTPGQDLELVRGLLHAESVPHGALVQTDDDAVDVVMDATAFTPRNLVANAACGVCGRVDVADLERNAPPATAAWRMTSEVLAALPARLHSAQRIFADTGGLHASALFTAEGELVAAREDVGRHNAVDKLVGWALSQNLDPSMHALLLSGRAGYELLQKAIRFGVPIVASVSAPSSLAIDLAQRFHVTLAGFVRDGTCNLYTHGWRIACSPATC